MFYAKYTKWWSTKHFRNLSIDFIKSNDDPNKRFYCPFDYGSKAHEQYWDEAEYYIKNGDVVDGQRIAGLHHLYLNYCPIYKKKKKEVNFPDFRVIDAETFLNWEYVLGLHPDGPDPHRPLGQTDSKSRQTGHSLKAMVPMLYYTHFIKDSRNYLGSYTSAEYEKTLPFFWKYAGHLTKFTDFGQPIAKRESGIKYEFGFYETINGQDVLSGINSTLECVSFKDNADKGVGGYCSLFIIEEAGKNPDLIKNITFISDACTEEDETTGNILVFGAAGAMDKAKPLGKLHANPLDYNFNGFDDKWNEKPSNKKVGYFIPNYSIRVLDADGNPDCEAGIIARDKALESMKKNDYRGYVEKISQQPNNPNEMFNLEYKRRFDSKPIEEAIAYLESRGGIGQSYDLWEDGETFEIKKKANSIEPINDYPVGNIIDKTGTVIIYEDPMMNIPENLYIGSIDSYNQQETTGDSYASIYIFKKVHNLADEGTHRVIVAEYFGRPKEKYTVYKILKCLAKMYRAKILPENEDTELTPWFINDGCDHLLADQPDIIRQYIPGSNVKRLKGIHAHLDLIIAADNKIERYLTQKLGTIYNEKGEIVKEKLGVDRIPSLGLLRELLVYVRDKDLNFDRVRTFGWLLMYEEETMTLSIKKTNPEQLKFLTKTENFFGRKKKQSFFG